MCAYLIQLFSLLNAKNIDKCPSQVINTRSDVYKLVILFNQVAQNLNLNVMTWRNSQNSDPTTRKCAVFFNNQLINFI